MQNITRSLTVNVSHLGRHTLLLLLLLIGVSIPQTVLGQVYFQASDLTVSATTTTATTNTLYFGLRGQDTTTTRFGGVDLGKGSMFDLNSGSLSVTSVSDTLGGATAKIPVLNSSIWYRVYLASSTTVPSYTQVPLSLTSSATGSTVTYSSNTTIDLLAIPRTIGGGTYKVDIYFDATYKNGTKPTTNVTDPGNGATNPYSATFQVIAPAVTPNGSITTWISNKSDAAGIDWLNPANWSNGVPTRNSNAIIPDKTVDTSTPLLGDPNAVYEVRTLTLQGLANSSRALIRIGQSITGGTATGASLRVYGDLNAFAGGVLAAVSGTNGSPNPLTNSTLVLARNDGGAQAVRGSKLSIVDIRIEGRGLKAMVATELAAPNTLTFAPDASGPGATLRTSGDNASRGADNIPDDNAPDSAFPLNTTQSASVNLKDSGFINGETNSSFVQGILIADRSLKAGVTQTFGNIGLDITPNRDIPSPNVVVTRTVGDPLRGPVTNTTGPSTTVAPQPVKRQYGVSGDVNNNTTSTVVFHYLNSADELNGISESSLTIFKTANNAPPFALVGRTGTVDLVNHTVTRADYDGSLNTLTLGDEFNPLPVQLIAFNAVRSGTNTRVTWATATEKNSKGFEVQVSIDGSQFRVLGFVASESPNSTQNKTYSYTDNETGKSGLRYYRLHQIDLDGSNYYSPVRVVSFTGSANNTQQVAISAYPNPFVNGDQPSLLIQATTTGTARLQIIDMIGREVAHQDFDTLVGVQQVAIPQSASFRTGMYIAKVTLSTGEVNTIRLQKQ